MDDSADNLYQMKRKRRSYEMKSMWTLIYNEKEAGMPNDGVM